MYYTISPEAENDLDNIWLHIANEDPQAADKVIDYIDKSFHTIATSPNVGRIREDLWPDAQCHNTGKGVWRSHFLIFYRIGKDSIEIARVVEGHRNITPDMFNSDKQRSLLPRRARKKQSKLTKTSKY